MCAMLIRRCRQEVLSKMGWADNVCQGIWNIWDNLARRFFDKGAAGTAQEEMAGKTTVAAAGLLLARGALSADAQVNLISAWFAGQHAIGKGMCVEKGLCLAICLPPVVRSSTNGNGNVPYGQQLLPAESCAAHERIRHTGIAHWHTAAHGLWLIQLSRQRIHVRAPGQKPKKPLYS